MGMEIGKDEYFTKVQGELLKLLVIILMVSEADVDTETDMREYGLESIALNEYSEKINHKFGISINPTVFYQNPTIKELTQYLLDKYEKEISLLYRKETASIPDNEQTVRPKRNYREIFSSLNLDKPQKKQKDGVPTCCDIAVIGMSGRFPGAANLDEYWKNLVENRDMISEIPIDRWNWEDFYGDPNLDGNKTNSKWGGFIQDIKSLDAPFFKISPREADLMDPQQRLLMEEIWKTMEDAGIRPSDLYGSDTGIFVGICNNDYDELILKSGVNMDAHTSTGSYFSIVPNRISYLLNIHGPSVPIDTACSSSLVAVHQAIQAIQNGDCKMSFAAGVNICCTPRRYLSFSNAGMLSPDGRCKTFDTGANGYVRGEGVGAVLLKPLEQAVQDGDHIYGIIKGSAVNHGGYANSLTAPNPNAQAELLVKAYQRAKFSPDTVTYIEAHGTATSLGDPIEINGLKKAFEQLYNNSGSKMPHQAYCGIGSVKTNIGHLESAAGIAGLIKLLLSMKHGLIPGILHFKQLNPYIDLEGSPFYIVSENRKWDRLQSEDGSEILRRCGVSSFGFGGANAHVVLEEYICQSDEKSPADFVDCIFVLSAKNEARLKEYSQRLSDHFKTVMGQQNKGMLENIAYTLQLGREAMDERICFTASTLEEASQKLDRYISGEKHIEKFYHGNVRDGLKFKMLFEDQDGSEYTSTMIKKRDYGKLGQLWANGINIKWELLYQGKLRKVSLPAYPFEKEQYWIKSVSSSQSTLAASGTQKEFCILKKGWKKDEYTNGEHYQLEGGYIVVVSKDSRQIFRHMNKCFPKADFYVIENNKDLNRNANDIPEQGKLIYQKACDSLKFPLNGMIDLSDLSDKQSDDISGNSYIKIALLQELIKHSQNENIHVLHLTRFLQVTDENQSATLLGAEFSGIVKMAGAEYKRVLSRTADIDVTDYEEIKEIILKEFQLFKTNPKQNEVCYRSGIRYIPAFNRIFSEDYEKFLHSKHDLNLDESKVVIITGGTRGIGAEIAKHLVKKGIKKLGIMGKEHLPHKDTWQDMLNQPGKYQQSMVDKVRLLHGFESQGVEIALYCGRLNDKEQLAGFFNNIRRNMGEINGVIHCAGLVSDETPTFINKSMYTFQKVFEPKIDGLITLHDVLKSDKLEFFLLFSSVSSIAPAFASGMMDYSAANSFLDHFAAYQRFIGNRYFKSINWQSWDGVGMGKITSPKYTESGLYWVNSNDGIKIFESLFHIDTSPNLFPCISKKDISHDKLIIPDIERNQGDVKNYTSFKPDMEPNLEKNCINCPEKGCTIKECLLDTLSIQLRIEKSKLDYDSSFSDIGIDSILIAEIVRSIEKDTGMKIEPSAIIEYPTVNLLGDYLKTILKECKSFASKAAAIASTWAGTQEISKSGLIGSTRSRIAVIGIGCIFPGAQNKDDFWQNLMNGVSSISEVPQTRWDRGKYYSPEYRQGKSISKWGGFIKDIEYFDAAYFGFKEEDAPHIDPLIRKVLEAGEETVRDAGYTKEEIWGKKIGVFVGSRVSNYSQRISRHLKNTITGIGQNFIAAHLSKFYNLKGPNMVLDTACSSSLVSLHHACKSLMDGESDMAFAGGVDILLDKQVYLILSESKALSPDGKCHTFDENANGFVPGEGCGLVLLKTLDKAVEDGDKIYAVIEATAINSDGHTMGTTTPNPQMQSAVIEDALKKADINPETIGYVETHGTGTMIGDPIELKALTSVFTKYTAKSSFCAVGSVKTNIGHLLSAAGIASIIKVALSIHHGKIVPTLNCHTPNPRFEFKNSPFYPALQLKEWEQKSNPLRAGISSFGFGGTNAHGILASFDKADYPQYLQKRFTLPPAAYDKKYYWLSSAGENDQAANTPEKRNYAAFEFVEVK